MSAPARVDRRRLLHNISIFEGIDPTRAISTLW